MVRRQLLVSLGVSFEAEPSAERIFSITRRLCGDLWQAMKEENLEERMWAKQHVLKARKKGIKPCIITANAPR